MQTNLSQNFFELFDLPVDFQVDTEALALRYRELQRTTHPDRFANAAEQERRLAVQQAAHVNEAYRTLKDPMARARYLLELRGAPIDETDTSMDPGFLMEQMELRESLEGVRGSEEPFDTLDRIRSDIEHRERALVEDLGIALGHGEGDVLERAKDSVRKLQFMRRLLSETEELEEALTHEL
ncbi:Fe-S protein assembly co-chaperone HscB [Thiohalomonas denitrificans]|uniref:Co-chaperone protein HscB homolog n=1 Tax=Thiohalomonas denitrificans TaxID=415747 RepID=A0A1G5Q230_9GAMM|nr:Fe-S protein assembly co-chaperone HscB [Thiohalomonas denitrificans]SCZ55461.1 molecular chaperone HscB [Thiohalomonas denitrificans]